MLNNSALFELSNYLVLFFPKNGLGKIRNFLCVIVSFRKIFFSLCKSHCSNDSQTRLNVQFIKNVMQPFIILDL